MKLLVVDDHKIVVDNILANINWAAAGISETFGACSAAEAREILSKQEIDILLCDIEMPIENGLSLIQWMRENNMRTRCILLTAHADFSYAQKSLSLAVFDYVVQPAPLPDIQAAVERAVRDILRERDESIQEKYEQVEEWQKNKEAASVLAKFLKNGNNYAGMEFFSRQGRIPPPDRKIFLVLMKILRWFSAEQWTRDFLLMMIHNAVTEVFSPLHALILPVHNESFAFVIWGSEHDPAAESISHQLSFMFNVCRLKLKCTVALFQEEAVLIERLEEAWHNLLKRVDNNDSQKTGVFITPDSGRNEEYTFANKELESWVDLLRGPKPAKMLVRAEAFFNALEKDGMTEKLPELYVDFMNVVHFASGGGNGNDFWREILVDSQSYDIYRNASRSTAQLFDLIRMVSEVFEKRIAANDNDMVSKITTYIDAHLDENIRREDLTAQVYFQADYLNRLFKKKTGCTLKDFIIRRKMEEAKKMLEMTSLPVSIIAAKVGYENFSHFSYLYKKVTGYSPTETRQGGRT